MMYHNSDHAMHVEC